MVTCVKSCSERSSWLCTSNKCIGDNLEKWIHEPSEGSGTLHWSCVSPDPIVLAHCNIFMLNCVGVYSELASLLFSFWLSLSFSETVFSPSCTVPEHTQRTPTLLSLNPEHGYFVCASLRGPGTSFHPQCWDYGACETTLNLPHEC